MSEDRVRRLHPAMALIGGLRQGSSNLVALAPAVALGMREGLGMFFLVLAIFALPMLALAVLRWWRFTYRIGEDDLVIEQGVLRRSHRSIPLDRIQDVSIEQNPLARVIGMGLVRIETGGSEADEGKLDSVSLAEARRLHEILRGAVRPPAASLPEAEPVPETVFAMPLERVLLSGLFGFSLWWIFVIFALLNWLNRTVPDLPWEHWVGVVQHEAEARFTTALAIEVGLVLLGAALVLGFLAGMAQIVMRDFGFRLTHGEGRFRRVRGLLTRSEVALVDRRIQLALVKRAMVSGALGWSALEFQTLGGSNDSGGRQEVAPFARDAEVARIVAVAGLPAFEAEALEPVAAGHVLRMAIRRGMPVLVAAGAAGFFWAPLWLGLVLVPLNVSLALPQRRHHRYGLRAGSVQVTRGALTRREWTLPYPAVQAVAISQSWLQRRLGTASVVVDAAGGGVEIADLAAADAGRTALEVVARAGC